ncbi:MAG: hypothetical protein HYT12_04835 [Candidatus Liptonbacteria bacterium]|nr:hypothetical protein [Candidatus Liptonbacteria bacterium]
MNILVATASILVITILMWFTNKILPLKVCPICAGVSLTWLWMLIGLYANQLSTIHYQLITAILMGGSVVGIAYRLEKYLRGVPALAFKIFFIPAGFVAAYSLINFWWITFAIIAGFLGIASLLAIRGISHKKSDNKTVEELESKMKGCC